MTVLITLTLAGTDSGPFSLYSNLDGYTTPFEASVNKAALQAGYSSSLVPDYTTSIMVKSTGDCVNNIIINVDQPTTTTTSSSTSSTSSTTSTTSTTTTAAPVNEFKLTNPFANSALACAETTTFPTDVQSDDFVIGLGSIIYYDNTTTPVAGGGFWYNVLPDTGTVYQINGSGVVIAMFVC